MAIAINTLNTKGFVVGPQTWDTEKEFLHDVFEALMQGRPQEAMRMIANRRCVVTSVCACPMWGEDSHGPFELISHDPKAEAEYARLRDEYEKINDSDGESKKRSV